MRMDDFAFGDIEYLICWHIQECELRQVEMCVEELISYPAGVLPADEHGSAFYPCEAGESGCAITFWIIPFPFAVKMVVGEDAFPIGCNLVICKADVAGANGTAREAADEYVVRVAAKFFTDPREVGLAVVHGCLLIAPPCDGIFFFSLFHTGHGYPDKSSPPTHAIAQVRIFYLTR